MRKAFSMITAIFLIVIMATVAILVFNLSGKMIKTTTTQYKTEQAALLARSYTELAVMAITNYNRNVGNDCIENINGVVNGIIPGAAASGSSLDGSGFDVETKIYYIGNNLPCRDSGTNKRKLTDSSLSSTTVHASYKQPGASDNLVGVIIDVFVRYKDPDMVDTYTTTNGTAPSATQIPWITYHRRTLQKI